jgi:putative GTP pyrophosphokinase
MSDTPESLTAEKFKKEYKSRKNDYKRLTRNIKNVVKGFLLLHKLPFAAVYARVKSSDSAFEKITRKGYKMPFDEIEDWCGIRIVCYYPGDISRINDIIREEFTVLSEEDVAARLAPNEFGYRSTHFIAKINGLWLNAPNYRGLESIKVEIQVRTISMHAWAEIEHKLQYKNADQVPGHLRRGLYRLGAKFEEADEQFEHLRNGIEEYQAQLSKSKLDLQAFKGLELNLDTLQAFLDLVYPDKKGGREETGLGVTNHTSSALLDISKAGLTMPEIIDAYELTKDLVIEAEERSKVKYNNSGWGYQVSFLSMALDIGTDKYYQMRKPADGQGGEWLESVQEYRNRLGKAI